MHGEFKNIQKLTDDRIATTALPLVYRPLPITLVTAHSIHIYVCTVYASSTKTSTIKSIQQVNIRKYTHTYVNTCSTLVHMSVCTLYCNIVHTVCKFSSHVCCTYVRTCNQHTYVCTCMKCIDSGVHELVHKCATIVLYLYVHKIVVTH